MVICLVGNLRNFFITHSFRNWFWYKFIWKLSLWIRKYFILISITPKVTEGHKRSSVYPVIFPNTFIYESILIKIYMNTNIMNTQILKVTKGHFYVYFNFNLRSYGQLFVLVYSRFKRERKIYKIMRKQNWNFNSLISNFTWQLQDK